MEKENEKQDVQEQDVKDNGQEKTVPYSRFREVNEKYKELETKINSLMSDKQKQDEEKMKEEGKYKDLLSQREKELNDLKARQLRFEVANEKEIPSFLADRLIGNSKEELVADAEKILAELGKTTKKEDKKQQTIPNTPDTSTKDFDIFKMTPAQIREALDKKEIQFK